MKSFEMWVLAYLLNGLWQIPLLVIAAWIAARLAARIGPRAEHRVWVAALLLETVLPACQLEPGELWRTLWRLMLPGNGMREGMALIVIGPGRVVGAGRFPLPRYAPEMLLCAYLACVLYFAARLAWGFAKTHRILRQAKPLRLEGEKADRWLRARRRLAALGGARASAPEIAVSPSIAGPVTAGVWRRILAVPPGFVENVSNTEMDALLAHEFAHMQRNDFAKNLVYGACALPVAWHPLVWLTRARLAETRELVCDAMAADAIDGRDGYARSLLQLAAKLAAAGPAESLHAMGIFDANHFERRIMNLTRKRAEVVGTYRAAILAVCGAIGLGVCASAMALRMDVNRPPATNSNPGRVHVKVDVLKITYKVPPVYPVEAKKSGNTLDGEVVMDVVVGKTGDVENIQVTKSLRPDYDKSAMDAVRQWKFEPYLLNGQPVEVATAIRIIYKLGKK